MFIGRLWLNARSLHILQFGRNGGFFRTKGFYVLYVVPWRFSTLRVLYVYCTFIVRTRTGLRPLAANRPVALSHQINAKLTCDFLIPNSYERKSDAPPHVRAFLCAAAAWTDLKLCTAAICEFRHQICAFARQEKDRKTVFEPLGNFFFFFSFFFNL